MSCQKSGTGWILAVLILRVLARIPGRFLPAKILIQPRDPRKCRSKDSQGRFIVRAGKIRGRESFLGSTYGLRIATVAPNIEEAE